MGRILYYLLLKPLSYLPFNILYYISDFLYFLLYKVFKYRKNVVRINLQNSFPEKTPLEIKYIERGFYRHFCDLLIESIKLFSISKEELGSRINLTNPDVLDRFYNEGKSVIIVGSHINNWEFGAAILNTQVKHQIIGYYAPLSSKFFEVKILTSRRKFGMEMISNKKVKEGFEKHRTGLTGNIFFSDQSPTHNKYVHWTIFLNQPTAVPLGAERYAKDYNYPLVYMYITKLSRGHYEMELRVLEENPTETLPGEITEKHVRWLEDRIVKDPQFWLWTHKRWKRKIKEEDSLHV